MKYFLSQIIILGVFLYSAEIEINTNWSFSLGSTSTIEDKAKVPVYPWFPDGHICVLPAGNGSTEYMMFWSGAASYRTIGANPYPESQQVMEPARPLIGGRENVDSWDNGGQWLFSVFRRYGDYLIGFYHAEDHWYPLGGNYKAWKSTAVTYSTDNGKTWAAGRQILTSDKLKPAQPEWGGTGDFCVVWDEAHKRYVCYFQDQTIRMAVCESPDSQPDSWFKYFEGMFSQPGLGGKSTPLNHLDTVPGTNPSVHWNSYLQRWLIVWYSWGKEEIWISSSTDMIHWEEPRILIKAEKGEKYTHPTIIGETDVSAGMEARLYYSYRSPSESTRKFTGRSITFHKKY